MPPDDNTHCYTDHVLAEHRRLHAMLRDMRAAIVHSTGPDEPQSFAHVSSILQRLQDELRHHFAEEEGGGCLDEAVSRCPRLSDEVKRVEAEHPEILAEIDRMIRDAGRLPPTTQNQLALQREFDELYRRLHDHEAAENRILAQGFGIAANGEDNIQPPLILDV
jgi:hypothetical protein